jgi:hypothetical protein
MKTILCGGQWNLFAMLVMVNVIVNIESCSGV